MSLINCTIKNNYAPGGSVLWAFDLYEINILIFNSTLEENYASTSMIDISTSSLKLMSCTIVNNLNSVIFISKVVLTMQNTNFSNNFCEAKQMGCLISSDQDSSLDLLSISVVNTTATSTEPGAFYITNSNLTLENSFFYNSTSLGLGACIYSFNSILNVKNSNFSKFYPSCIYLNSSTSVLSEISMGNSSVIYSPITVTFSKAFILGNSYFFNNYGAKEGAALYFQNNMNAISQTQIISTKFYRNTAKNNGGAIIVKNENISFFNCLFEENQALIGGALYLENTMDSSGGSYLISSSFLENNAGIDGGAVKFTEKWPILNNVTMSNNSAVYGNDYAAYNVRIAFQIYEIYNETSK